MLLEEFDKMLSEWDRAQTVIADGRVVFPLKLVLRFNDGPVRGAEGQESNIGALLVVDLRLRTAVRAVSYFFASRSMLFL